MTTAPPETIASASSALPAAASINRPKDALEAEVAVAKIGKYATSESGDTVEIVERPHGGLSIVAADGQRSGRSAKTISNIVVRKAISLLAEGVRDGAVARATHDYLRTHRGGKVSAELSIVSIDLVTATMVLSRNSRCPVWLRQANGSRWLDQPSEAIGIHRNTKPAITEIPLQAGLTLVVFTDGILGAGARTGGTMDLDSVFQTQDGENQLSAQELADAVLDAALALDQGRPQDDATVLVIKLKAHSRAEEVRRLRVRFPL